MRILDSINTPADLKSLSIAELKILAEEIREFIIRTVSQTGGHLAPNLGAVELTLALHYVFDAPTDKIIWDVGHQSYTHKIITGRKDKFHTLRQYGGISGFPSRDESEYDVFGTGHAGTSISAALGIAVARDLKGEDYKVIAVIGDGALTAGMAYEGLNQLGFLKTDMIVVLNDNQMSISKNVGGMSAHLSRIATSPVYRRLKDKLWEMLNELPNTVSEPAIDMMRRIKESIRSLAGQTTVFEELGISYVGPIDGHDLEQLIDTFKRVKRLRGPYFVHVITQKGYGYRPATYDPTTYHGPGPFDPDTGELIQDNKLTYSKLLGRTLAELAADDERIVAVTAAMLAGTGLQYFKERYPERCFDVGIAEQHAVTFSAGLAVEGLRPVCAIYSTFLQRAFDQVIHDVAIQRLPVVFVIDRAGIVGGDGVTHQGIFDISYLRMIPNIVVMAPKDGDEFRDMLYTAIEYEDGPVAIRYPKATVDKVDWRRPMRRINIGEAEVLRVGADGNIVAIGSMVQTAVEASKILKQRGYDVGIINARFVKPLDRDVLQSIADRPIITVEENTVVGGFGAAVREMLTGVEILNVGIEDEFVKHGSRKQLLEIHGLTPNKIASKVGEFLSQKRRIDVKVK